MFTRILVAIDTSLNDHHVFQTALSLAELTQARLLLAHILPDAEQSPQHLEDEKGLEMLRHFHSLAKACGIGADIAQPLANPGDKICNLAIDWGADLIIMGRRDAADLEVSMQSSVSNYVVCNAACPVLVTQHQKLVSTTRQEERPMMLNR